MYFTPIMQFSSIKFYRRMALQQQESPPSLSPPTSYDSLRDMTSYKQQDSPLSPISNLSFSTFEDFQHQNSRVVKPSQLSFSDLINSAAANDNEPRKSGSSEKTIAERKKQLRWDGVMKTYFKLPRRSQSSTGISSYYSNVRKSPQFRLNAERLRSRINGDELRYLNCAERQEHFTPRLKLFRVQNAAELEQEKRHRAMMNALERHVVRSESIRNEWNYINQKADQAPV